MGIPKWAWYIGGAVAGYFVLQQFAPDILSQITSTVSGAISGITGGAGGGGGTPEPDKAANVGYRSNRVTYYNPQNMYRSNVAYGYGPQSASGPYNSFRFTDF